MTNWVEMQPDLTPTWDYKKNKVIEGVLTEKKENVGPNESNLYIIQDPAGKEVGVWGSTLIDARLSKAPIGIEVKIEYLGLETSPKTKREYQNFKISKKEDTEDDMLDTLNEKV